MHSCGSVIISIWKNYLMELHASMSGQQNQTLYLAHAAFSSWPVTCILSLVTAAQTQQANWQQNNRQEKILCEKTVLRKFQRLLFYIQQMHIFNFKIDCLYCLELQWLTGFLYACQLPMSMIFNCFGPRCFSPISFIDKKLCVFTVKTRLRLMELFFIKDLGYFGDSLWCVCIRIESIIIYCLFLWMSFSKCCCAVLHCCINCSKSSKWGFFMWDFLHT